jgi:hypothetical protein
LIRFVVLVNFENKISFLIYIKTTATFTISNNIPTELEEKEFCNNFIDHCIKYVVTEPENSATHFPCQTSDIEVVDKFNRHNNSLSQSTNEKLNIDAKFSSSKIMVWSF